MSAPRPADRRARARGAERGHTASPLVIVTANAPPHNGDLCRALADGTVLGPVVTALKLLCLENSFRAEAETQRTEAHTQRVQRHLATKLYEALHGTQFGL